MSDDAIDARPPVWFWVVAVLGLVWEGFGVTQYLMHVGVLPNTMEMSPAERSLMESSPMWVTGLFAIGVFGGALGALGLALRQGWARLLLIVSLIAVILQFGGWLLATDAIAVIGPTVFVMPAIIVAVAILLVWIAGLASKRGWLRYFISPRARRIWYQRCTFALCSASVAAKTWPPLPSATK